MLLWRLIFIPEYIFIKYIKFYRKISICIKTFKKVNLIKIEKLKLFFNRQSLI